MLYTNMPKNPPMTERPTVALMFMEYEAAAPLLFVDDGEVPELVPDPVSPLMVVGLSVADTQVSFPWTTLPSKDLKPEQSIVAVL